MLHLSYELICWTERLGKIWILLSLSLHVEDKSQHKSWLKKIIMQKQSPRVWRIPDWKKPLFYRYITCILVSLSLSLLWMPLLLLFTNSHVCIHKVGSIFSNFLSELPGSLSINIEWGVRKWGKNFRTEWGLNIFLENFNSQFEVGSRWEVLLFVCFILMQVSY